MSIKVFIQDQRDCGGLTGELGCINEEAMHVHLNGITGRKIIRDNGNGTFSITIQNENILNG